MNLLCSNVSTSHLVTPHLGACLQLALRGLGARHSYNVRQAALSLYGRLLARMVSQKRGRDEHDKASGANPTLSVAAFFRLCVRACVRYSVV